MPQSRLVQPPVSQNTGGSRYGAALWKPWTLAHQEQDAVVAAYARSELFAKRRTLMEQWEAWCVSCHPPSRKAVGVAAMAQAGGRI